MNNKILDDAINDQLDNDDLSMTKLLLYFIFPNRTDYSDIAKLLLLKYFSFDHIIEVPTSELSKTLNITQQSARAFSYFKQITQYYYFNKVKKIDEYVDTKQIVEYFHNILFMRNKEYVFAIGLNKNNKILVLEKLAEGIEAEVCIDKKTLSEFCIKNDKITKIVLAHNHPNSTCEPSKSDDLSTSQFQNWLSEMGIILLDHIIIGYDGAFSFKEIQFYK